MKICKDTSVILKSFAGINPVLYFGDPKAVKVVASGNAIIGVYQPAESFNHDCAFWETPSLLATIDSMGGENAELDFQEKFVKIISPDKSSLKYFYTNKLVIAQSNPEPKPYESYCKPFDVDFEFEMSSEIFSKVIKIAHHLSLTKLMIELVDGKGVIHIIDDAGKISHDYEYEFEGKGTGKLSIYIASLNNIIAGTYSIIGKSNVFAKFVNKNIPLFYIIAGKKE